MDTEMKTKWVAALRSGDYQQGKSRLRKVELDGSESYCCLGVLCDIVDSSNWTLAPTRGDGDVFYRWGSSSSSLLPTELATRFELERYESKLMLMNDNPVLSIYGERGTCTFADIADHIEKNVHE
jgi:hypothetical protein